MEENTADDVDVVLVAARDAMGNARARTGPKMGAALLSSTGAIYTGCSVETADPTASLSAAGCALGRAVADGATQFERLVVVNDGTQPRFPSGAARQALFELAPNLTVVAETLSGDRMVVGIDDLVPHGYRG